MEFVVELDIKIPDGTRDSEVQAREAAEASDAAKMADDGFLARLWNRPHRRRRTQRARPIPRRDRNRAR
jgi:muconolactone delta-isomerase